MPPVAVHCQSSLGIVLREAGRGGGGGGGGGSGSGSCLVRVQGRTQHGLKKSPDMKLLEERPGKKLLENGDANDRA